MDSPVAAQIASARDITNSAVMVVVPKKVALPVKLTLATAASEDATVPPPTTAVWEAPTANPLATLASSAEASCAPPETASAPLSATDTALPSTNPETAEACPWKLAELLVLLLPPNMMICACSLVAGKQHNSPVNRVAATGRGNDVFFIVILLLLSSVQSAQITC